MTAPGSLRNPLSPAGTRPVTAGNRERSAPAWAGTLPIEIKSVTFGDGSTARHWAVVSDYGGKAEVNQYCGAANYGNPFCIYPWFTLGTSGFHRISPGFVWAELRTQPRTKPFFGGFALATTAV